MTSSQDINPIITYQPNDFIRPFSPIEIVNEIAININLKKAPRIDEISPCVLKEFSRKVKRFTTYLFNACLHMKQHMPTAFNTIQIIMLKKPDIPSQDMHLIDKYLFHHQIQTFQETAKFSVWLSRKPYNEDKILQI